MISIFYIEDYLRPLGDGQNLNTAEIKMKLLIYHEKD
jgi:hypothetical protein